MALYSLLLAAAFILGGPYWLARMLTSGRYRAGLRDRLGRVPPPLRAAAAGRNVVWLHAVSVGEVLAATRLVAELEASLGTSWLMVVSTTTAAGQALARERFAPIPSERVFYYPLDFRFAVRAWLKALQPRLLILMESELWPRMLLECRRAHVPVAVVNARVSDRSFARAIKARAIWRRLLATPALFLAQSQEDARRLIALGADAAAVRVSGNLKYDILAPAHSPIAARIQQLAAGRPVLVAGSTHGPARDQRLSEEELVIEAWKARPATQHRALLVLAPRHPQRFAEVESVAMQFRLLKASSLASQTPAAPEIILLDTIGDLASVYAVADAAFVGGSLVPRGGHNPLEPALFGVPVVIGPSYQNFRDIVARMREVDGIAIVQNGAQLEQAFAGLLANPDQARALGARGRSIFEQQQGATARTVKALLALLAASPGAQS